MREAGFDKKEHKRNGDFNFYLLRLNGGKGTNERDELIRNTLQARHNVQLADDDLLEFSNFLTSLDPTYPGWSEVGEYTAPMLLKDSKRYYDAYLKFKAKK